MDEDGSPRPRGHGRWTKMGPRPRGHGRWTKMGLPSARTTGGGRRWVPASGDRITTREDHGILDGRLCKGLPPRGTGWDGSPRPRGEVDEDGFPRPEDRGGGRRWVSARTTASATGGGRRWVPASARTTGGGRRWGPRLRLTGAGSLREKRGGAGGGGLDAKNAAVLQD